RALAHLPECLTPEDDGSFVEEPCFAKRLRRQELIDECRDAFGMKTVERRSEHRLAPPSDLAWEPAFGQEPQDVLVLKATQLPFRMEPGQISEHVFIEKWIARFH